MGHTGTGWGSGWHLGKVEVRRLLAAGKVKILLANFARIELIILTIMILSKGINLYYCCFFF